MKSKINILKAGILGLLVISSFLKAQIISAQSGDSSSVSGIKGESQHSLFAGGGYGSNMIYLGSTISQNQPFGYASVSYGYKNELYATISAIHLSGVDPFGAFYTGSLSYSHTFNSWFDLSAGLYRYMVAPVLADTLFNSFTYSDITLGFDWKILYTKLSGGGLFTGDNQIYFQVRNSRYFQTPEIFGGKANISFDPYVNFLFGTITSIESAGETQYFYSVSSHSGSRGKKGQSQQSTIIDKFSLLELDFGIPIDLNTNFMTIEAEPSYVVTMYDDLYYPGTKGFVFQMSIFFRFF